MGDRPPVPQDRRRLAVDRVRAAVPEIADAVTRAFVELDWFRDMDPNARSWIGMFVQREVSRIPDALPSLGTGAGPVGRLRFPAIPWNVGRGVNLEEGLELVRIAAEVVAERIDAVVRDLDVAPMLLDLERYGREFAFAAAAAYAKVAEQRGASDAQLQALLIRALVGGADPAEVEASSLGLPALTGPVQVVGVAPSPDRAAAELVELQRAAHHHKVILYAAIHGPYAVAVVPAPAAELLVKEVASRSAGAGPVLGPVAPELRLAGGSARAVLSALRALPAWRGPSGPVDASELLVERVLAGDPEAVAALVTQAYVPLVESGRGLLETVDALLRNDGSLDAAARSLPVHVNTIRYRLDRVLSLTGLDPRRTRDAIALHTALALGRMRDALSGGSSGDEGIL